MKPFSQPTSSVDRQAGCAGWVAPAETGGDELARRSVRGGAVTLAAQIVRLLIRLVQVPLLARLLAPSDFGLVAMVTAITGFMEGFKDLGLSLATVQSRHLREEQVTALFWLNASLGVLLAVLCAAAGPLMAGFFGDPRLSLVAAISALGLLISGFAVQHRALLSRQMRFGPLAVVDLASAVGSASVALTLASSGFGYLALAWAPVAAAAVNLSALILFSNWRPGWPRRAAGIGPLLRFGGEISAFNAITYLARNLDNVLIGRFWGAQSLGLYSRAYNLLVLPVRQVGGAITTVAFPALSTLQADPARFRGYYLNVLFAVLCLTTPLYLALGILAPDIVLIILGPQWSRTADIFRLLAISALALPITNTSGLIYTALGNSRGLRRAGTLGTIIIVAFLIVGLPYGPEGVAAGYAVAMLLWLYPCMSLAVRGTALRTADIFRTAFEPLAASVPGVLWILSVKYTCAGAVPLWAWLPLALAGMGALYAFMLVRVLKKSDLLLAVVKRLIAGA